MKVKLKMKKKEILTEISSLQWIAEMPTEKNPETLILRKFGNPEIVWIIC